MNRFYQIEYAIRAMKEEAESAYRKLARAGHLREAEHEATCVNEANKLIGVINRLQREAVSREAENERWRKKIPHKWTSTGDKS